MMRARACWWLAGVLLVAGCQAPLRPVFPTLDAPRVWPPAPDVPRVRYVGELRGEGSLHRPIRGWESLRAVVAGPRPTVEFSRPSAVAVRGPLVYVADTGLAVVHCLNLDTREYQVWAEAGEEALQVPIDVGIDPDGNVFVVDRGRAAIDLFTPDGQWRKTIRLDALPAPVAAVTDRDQRVLWVLDAKEHTCCALGDAATLVTCHGQRGSGAGQFNFPTAVAWQPQVGLVVADAMNFRVVVLDAAGEPTSIFGQKGDAAGCFARPRGVAVDSEGHIYVLDNQFENVQVFDATGQLLMALGGEGTGPGEFALPSGITIDENDRIWIADSYNRRVQVFQYLAENAAWADSD